MVRHLSPRPPAPLRAAGVRAVLVAVLATPACGGAEPGDPDPAAGAQWPMPNPPGTGLPNATRLVAAGETVKDEVTGLVWERGFSGPSSWDLTHRRCQDLTRAGRDDWRLPARIELVSIVDFTRVPSVDPEAFSGTPALSFWSATTLRRDGNVAFNVLFRNGTTAMAPKDDAGGHGRCVRGGARRGGSRYVVAADEVLDRGTGLYWQRRTAGALVGHHFAAAFCVALDIGGAHSWRLPSLKELQTLVDDARSAPALDQTAFSGEPAAAYWTSTQSPEGDRMGALVEFGDGQVDFADPTETHRVRCVR